MGSHPPPAIEGPVRIPGAMAVLSILKFEEITETDTIRT